MVMVVRKKKRETKGKEITKSLSRAANKQVTMLGPVKMHLSPSNATNTCTSTITLPCTRHIKWNPTLRFLPPSSSSSELVIGKPNTITPRHKRPHLLYCQKQQAPLLDCRSIDEVYDSLAQRLLFALLQIQDSTSKYIVGLAGPPGAGKSTLAREVVLRINSLWSAIALEKGSNGTNGEVATVLPMDGFHLYRSQLDQMEDPDEAHARRGAPWTFNPDLLLNCLLTLRKEGSVYAPSFDHGIGDPVENDIHVSAEHKIVIVEGNYLLLEEDTWKDISLLFDEKWFIDIDIDVSMERVLKRHVSTGKEPDVAAWRILYNDRPNAELIMKSKNKADLVIQSIDL